MDSRSSGTSHESDVIQFARGVSKTDNDQLDKAGQTILQLIHRAAGFAEQNSRQALEMAQKLSNQLQTAEARVAELEVEVDNYREKADRRSNGCITSTRRLKTDFFGRAKVCGASRSGAGPKAPSLANISAATRAAPAASRCWPQCAGFITREQLTAGSSAGLVLAID